MKYFTSIAIIIIILFAYFSLSNIEDINTEQISDISAAAALSGDNASGFAKADSIIQFNFPEDHASHDMFKTEWWYFTGNLNSGDKRFGYQFTIFRNALKPEIDSNSSDWETSQIYLAHFALTDAENNRFYFDEKLSRHSANLSGSKSDPLKVWVEDWQITGDYSNGYNMPTFKIYANTDNFGLDIELKPQKLPIFQGENGLSAKSSTSGNASYYYSYTRLQTTGKIEIADNQYIVKGYSWMDREWSTSALEKGQKGWDWFSLQLDDNTEIMYFKLRGKDNSSTDFAKGSYINQQGEKSNLESSDIKLEILNLWQNNAGAEYPAKWNLKIPAIDININIEPLINDQELKLSVRYWEGAVDISGTKNGEIIKGKGYVEMTGYNDKNLSIK